MSRPRYRYPDRAAYEAALTASERRTHWTEIALEAMMTGPRPQHWTRAGVTVHLIAPHRLDGGAILETWAPGGQRPMRTAYGLEEWRARAHELGRLDHTAPHASLLPLVSEAYFRALREPAEVA